MLAPFPLPDGAPQTLSLQYFADDRSVIVLLAGGDIAVLQLEDPNVGVVPVSSIPVLLTPDRGRWEYRFRDQGSGMVAGR